MDLDDWRPAPNIRSSPGIYERENEALARDGRLDRALDALVDAQGKVVLDIGCGTGFWLDRWPDAARVVGVEPDPELRALATARVAERAGVEVRAGSAEHLPLAEGSVDVAHARFAYFFGPGSERGLAEVGRVLRPDGVLLVIDNSWRSGHFAELLRDATTGNAALDPEATERWWAERGAVRVEVEGGWRARDAAELARILRIEFPADTVERWLARHPGRAALDYAFAVYVWRR